MRYRHAIAAVGSLAAAFLFAANPTQAEEEDRFGSGTLCPVTTQEIKIYEFPYVMEYGKSWFYPDNPRSCSWDGKRTITYWCSSKDPDTPTYLNVIANRGNKRLVQEVICDGTQHTGGAELYPDFPGPYHVHWHVREGEWNSAGVTVW